MRHINMHALALPGMHAGPVWTPAGLTANAIGPSAAT
jgi:hypothetical protein